MGQSYTVPVINNVFYLETEVGAWHQTPLQIVATIATGPPHIYTLPVTPGSEIKYPGGLLRLLAMAPLKFDSTSTSYDGKTNQMTLTSSAPEGDNRKYTTLLV
jgi:hypothetical protein